MKTTHFVAFAISFGLLGACGSSGSSTTNGSGGSAGNANGGSTATGGNSGNTGGGATTGGNSSGTGGGNATGGGGGATATGGNGTGGKGNGGATATGGSGGAACVAGVECSGFPTNFVTGCTNDDSCVGEVHQTDCCGAKRVLGMNHSEAGKYCPAETQCVGKYPTLPGCTSDKIVTDSGTATSMDNVAAHCDAGNCKTFVCGTASTSACPATRHIGTCGP